jgi:hypothetical protein
MPEEVTRHEEDTGAGRDPDPVLLQGWLDQATEWSKSIFTMSSVAIGLIVTGVFTAPARPNPVTLIFLSLAATAFAVATISCVTAFSAGADVIYGLMMDDSDQVEKSEKILARLKPVQQDFFVGGLVLLLVAAFFHMSAPDATQTSKTAVHSPASRK